MHWPRLNVQFGNKVHILRGVRAFAGLFPGKKFGVDKQAMLEIVDA
jgi:hypothetical protein